MSGTRIALVAASFAFAVAACGDATGTTSPSPTAPATPSPSPLTAKADLVDGQGQSIGVVTLRELSGGGVSFTGQVSRLTAGAHGMHVHAVGKCEAPAFTTAGGHFNPYGKKHGLNSADGPHAGDLPNLVVAGDGTATVSATGPLLALKVGAPNSLFSPDGTVLVIHASPDDGSTDPSGNSGPRVACGVITRG